MKTLKLTRAEAAAYAAGERCFWRQVKPGPRQGWLHQSSIDASPGGYQWTDDKGQLWRQFYCKEAGTFAYGVQHAPDSPLTSIKCPYGTPGDRIELNYNRHGDTDEMTITDITVTQRDGKWGWLVEVGS